MDIKYFHWLNNNKDDDSLKNIVNQVGSLNLGKYTEKSNIFYENLFFKETGTNLFDSQEYENPKISIDNKKNSSSIANILQGRINSELNITNETVTEEKDSAIIKKLINDLKTSIEEENYFYNIILNEQLNLGSVNKDNIDASMQKYLSFYKKFRTEYYNILKNNDNSFILLLECLTENRLRPYVADMSKYYNEFEIAKQIYDPKRMWERESDKSDNISVSRIDSKLQVTYTGKDIQNISKLKDEKELTNKGIELYKQIKSMVGQKNSNSIYKTIERQKKEIDERMKQFDEFYPNNDKYAKAKKDANIKLSNLDAELEKIETSDQISILLPAANNIKECVSNSGFLIYTFSNKNNANTQIGISGSQDKLTIKYSKSSAKKTETKELDLLSIKKILKAKSDTIQKFFATLKETSETSEIYNSLTANNFISNITKNFENYFTEITEQSIQANVLEYMNQFYISNINPTEYIQSSFKNIKNKYKEILKNSKIEIDAEKIQNNKTLIANVVLTTQLTNTKTIQNMEDKIDKENSQLLKSFSKLVNETYKEYKNDMKISLSQEQIQNESLPKNLSYMLGSIDDKSGNLLEQFKDKFWKMFEKWLQNIFKIYGVIKYYENNEENQKCFEEGFKQMAVSFEDASKVYVDMFTSPQLTQGFLGEYYINVLGIFLSRHSKNKRYQIVRVNNIGGNLVNNQQMSADNVFTILDTENMTYYSIGLQAKNPFKSHVSENYTPYSNKYSPSDKQILYYFNNNKDLFDIFKFSTNNIIFLPQDKQNQMIDILNSLLMIYYQNFGRIGKQYADTTNNWVRDILKNIPNTNNNKNIKNLGNDTFYVTNSFLLSDSQVILPKSYIILGIIYSILKQSEKPDIDLKIDIKSSNKPTYDFSAKPFSTKTSNVVISSITTWKNKKLSENLQKIDNI